MNKIRKKALAINSAETFPPGMHREQTRPVQNSFRPLNGRAGFLAAMLVAGMVCGMLPAAAQTRDAAAGGTMSPFGIGGSTARTRDRNFADWIPQMEAIGIHGTRSLGGTGWSGESERKWETLDWQYEFLTSHGFTHIGGGFYNYRPGPEGFPMDDLPGWSADVGRLVTHFRGKIRYWEVWNEPPNGTPPTQTAADYAKYVVATYDAAKRADRECLIGLAAKSVAVNYLDQAIKAGARGHFDYITLHPYETLDCLREVPGAEPVYMCIVQTVRKMLAARDPARIRAPILFTELGVDSKHGEPVQASLLVKAYTMGIAQGVMSIDWYEGIDGDSGPLGLLRGDGKPRLAYTAMGAMIKVLGQHPVPLGWILLNDRNYGFVFQGAAGPVLITWAPLKSSDTVDFGRPVRVTDPLTGHATEVRSLRLTDTPVLIEAVPDTLIAQARANQNKPFPWDGDYTNAKSVSVTMGRTNVEKGLHTRSAKSVAEAVVAYGGNARAGNVPGGNVFMVDPNFLLYDSTPIEISAVVRRNDANDPAQIRLEYESTGGFKKTAPYEVPDNKQWHTARWRITDSQFVGMWAFNFRLDPGNYLIQSVTVTKIGR